MVHVYLDIEVNFPKDFERRVVTLRTYRDVICKTCRGSGCENLVLEAPRDFDVWCDLRTREDRCKTCNGEQVVPETKDHVLDIDGLDRETRLVGEGNESPYEDTGDIIIFLINRNIRGL